MAERGTRDEMVIATKYCGNWQLHNKEKHRIQSNFGAASTKNLHVCVKASLRKLKTSYIDRVCRFTVASSPHTSGQECISHVD